MRDYSIEIKYSDDCWKSFYNQLFDKETAFKLYDKLCLNYGFSFRIVRVIKIKELVCDIL